MHRQALISLLDRYGTSWPSEADTALRFRDFVIRNPECFERHLEEGHVTGSAWIIDSTGERTLLTHHRKLNIWLQPGGHADGDPDVLSVARRECLEETGLTDIVAVSEEIFDLDIHGIPARKEIPGHYHYDVRFLFRVVGDHGFVVSEESHDLAWVPLDKLEEYTIEWSMRRMREKTFAMR